jgi:hypothetical protein
VHPQLPSVRMTCLDKKCPVCGKVYMTFDKKKKYCSDACAKRANKAK